MQMADTAPPRTADPRGDGERWRDLAALASDFAYETDSQGRLIEVTPGSALGWPAEALLNRSSQQLLASTGSTVADNPLQSPFPQHDHRVLVRRSDGTQIWMSLRSKPLHNAHGALIGVRGTLQDLTAQDAQAAALARAERKSELLDQILWHVHGQAPTSRLMIRVLAALAKALDAQGAMIVATPTFPAERGADPLSLQPPFNQHHGSILKKLGEERAMLADLAAKRLNAGEVGPLLIRDPDGLQGAFCATQTRFGGNAGLLLWREPARPGWAADDLALLAATAGTIALVLEHGLIQRELASVSRTDALTGLFNRPAFAEEMGRRIDRLDREGLPGTLFLIDIDHFRALNSTLGLDGGDAVLKALTELLRTASRPGDLLARIEGDTFAVWMDGMDDLAAAERADLLCRLAPAELASPRQHTTLSVGYATRWPGSSLDTPLVLRRASQALRVAQRSGHGGWHPWRAEMDPGGVEPSAGA